MNATPVRFARCENEIEHDDGARITYTPCTGLLTFRPQDGDAACGTCGARCGSLVADYIDPAGAWPQAFERWREAIAEGRLAFAPRR